MLEQYYRINKAAGISITTDSAGDISVNACSIQIQNNQLNFESKITDIVKIEDLVKHFAAKSFIALNLSGKGILQKQTERIEEIDQHNFGKILPNANPDDFYVQNFISGDQSFVSVIRKSDADKWISRLQELGFVPLALSLGPFPAQNIIPQLNIYGNEIIFNGNIIQRDENGNWTSCRYDETALSQFPVKIELEAISEKLIVPYAAAFQMVLASGLDAIEAHVPALETAFQQRLTDNKLKVKGVMVLAVFFVLLLVNFILFSWLGSSNSQLANQVSITAQSTTDLQSVNDQVKQKEGLLKNLGWEGGINKSVLVDQIASLLPPELSWREVAVDPVDLSSSRTQRSLIFFNREIRITGNSQKIIPVNEWIARVKTKAWVKNIQLDSYTYNNELNTGQFTIIIDY
jgi:hypothetical protein